MKKRRLLAVTLVLALVLGSVALPAGAAFQDAKGHWAQEAIERMKGIHCGAKSTSCPDQLARGLEQILAGKAQ